MHRKKYAMQIKRITIRKSILNLEAFVAQYHISYKTLQSYNPWIKQNALTISKATPVFELLIPVVLQNKAVKNNINPVPDSTIAMVKY